MKCLTEHNLGYWLFKISIRKCAVKYLRWRCCTTQQHKPQHDCNQEAVISKPCLEYHCACRSRLNPEIIIHELTSYFNQKKFFTMYTSFHIPCTSWKLQYLQSTVMFIRGFPNYHNKNSTLTYKILSPHSSYIITMIMDNTQQHFQYCPLG